MKIWYLILRVFLITLLMPVYLLNAQVTIGSGNDPIGGALLDLKEKVPINPSVDNTTAGKGLMLPRVTLSKSDQLYPMFEESLTLGKYKYGTSELDKADEDAKHSGLTVYNLTDDCLFCPGIYTWDGAIWQRLMKACCPCLLSVTSGGTLHQSVTVGDTPTLGTVTAIYYGGGTHPTEYKWYSNTTAQNTGGTEIAGAVGSTYVVPATLTPTSGTYYFYCMAINTCNNKSMASAVYRVDVVDPCAGIAVTNKVGGSVCGSGTVTLKATSSTGAVIRWYDAQTGGNLLQTGTSETDSYTTVNLSANKTYWVEAYNAVLNCISPREAIIATVNVLPVAPTGAIGATICQNNVASLSATAPAGCTLDWYDAAVGGTRVAYGANTYTTPSLSATKTYYAQARNTATGCTSASRLAVTATVTPKPTIIGTPSGTTFTDSGTAIATPSAGASIRWFSTASGGTQIGAGNSLPVTVTCATQNVYAEAYNSCGVSARTQFTFEGVQPKIHGTVTITRVSTFYDEVTLTFNDSSLPPANWIPLRGSGFEWQTPSISTATTYKCQIRNKGQAGLDYSWILRVRFGDCGWQIECEADAWREYGIWLSGQRLGTFYSNVNGASVTFNF